MFLAASAGSLDAYSYLLHGQVFVGLQTGNLILLGINVGEGNFYKIWRYLFAISMFMIGVMILRFVQHFYDHQINISRQSIVVWYEIFLLILVMLISGFVSDLTILAILSMAAAAQLQEFRKLKGSSYNSLMMTGNLRTVSENIYDGIFRNSKSSLQIAGLYFSIILSFFSGVILTSLLIHHLNEFSVSISIILLLTAMFISHFETK